MHDPNSGAGSADESSAWRAIATLRTELLYAAVGYGIYAALSEGGGMAAAAEWREWLEWVDEFVGKLGTQRSDSSGFDPAPPGWLMQARQMISAFEDTGGRRRDDVLTDSAVQLWLRTEFEKIAEYARPIEERAGEPLGEILHKGTRAGMALLGVVVDSLVLAAEDAGARAMRASSAEVYAALVAAREEGVWDIFVGE